MQTRAIGSLDVSVVGIGCNNFGRKCDEQATAAIVHAALDAGITFFDTADTYGGTTSEVFLGVALGSRRDDAIVATKFGGAVDDNPSHAGASARWIEQAAEDSLRRLGTDRIDLYQLHVPDPNVPIDETLTALDRLVQAGKVREIGNSNFSADQIRAADDVSTKEGLARFVSAQNEYSLLRRAVEREVLPACEHTGLALLPYFPLASGLLTGKYRRDEEPPAGSRLATWPADRTERLMTERNFDLVDRLDGFARDHGHSLLDLAFAWLLARPVVASVIAGATSPAQVASNAAAGAWALTSAELQEIDALLA